jgi:hypothetical protein
MAVIAEQHIGSLKFSETFNIRIRTVVHQDIGYVRVGEKGFDGAESEGLMLDFNDEAFNFLLVEGDSFLGDDALDDEPDFVGEFAGGQGVDFTEIEPFNETSVHALFQFLEVGEILFRGPISE